MSIEIAEGELSFTFNSDNVTKYDDWSFYRNRTETFGGMKAVDFIFLDDTELWLIEVKDYRENPRSKSLSLWDEVSFKVRDTLCGLVCAKMNANSEDEKNSANKFLKAKRINVVLHLEQPRKPSKLYSEINKKERVNIQIKLNQYLKKTVGKGFVVNQDEMHHTMKWSVKNKRK